MVDSQILMLALGNWALAVSLFFFHGSAESAPKTWFRARSVQALAWTLLFFGATISDFFSGLIGHALLFGGIVLEAGAIRESNELDDGRKILLPAWVISTGIFIVFWFASGSANIATVVCATFIVSALYGAVAATFIPDWRNASRLRRFVALATALVAGIIALGGLLAVLKSFSLVSIQTGTLMGLYLLMLINGFGFLLLIREQHETRLHHLALVDPLTGAPNRRSFLSALNPWLALARRPGNNTAVLMLDLDHLKRINDNYGHAVGDQVLKEVVEIGLTQLRDSDMIGRLGGDEFAVLLPRTSLEDARLVTERMRLAIMALQIKTGKAVLSVTASFGVTLIEPDDTLVSLIKRADEAMLAAKNAGRNCVEVAPLDGGLMVS
jgi:diguanylate cyclase (GGDEF)-like protein